MKNGNVYIDLVFSGNNARVLAAVRLIFSVFLMIYVGTLFAYLFGSSIPFTCKWFVDFNNGGDWMGVSGHRRAQAIKRKTLFPRFGVKLSRNAMVI